MVSIDFPNLKNKIVKEGADHSHHWPIGLQTKNRLYSIIWIDRQILNDPHRIL